MTFYIITSLKFFWQTKIFLCENVSKICLFWFCWWQSPCFQIVDVNLKNYNYKRVKFQGWKQLLAIIFEEIIKMNYNHQKILNISYLHWFFCNKCKSFHNVCDLRILQQFIFFQCSMFKHRFVYLFSRGKSMARLKSLYLLISAVSVNSDKPPWFV